MAKRVQRRRGTTLEHSTFHGAPGEITVDTDKNTIVVHDGVTFGGIPLMKEDFSNADASQGRSALALGTAATENVGNTVGQIPLNTQNASLGSAAYRNVAVFGSGNTNEVVSLESTNTLGSLNGKNIYNINAVEDRVTQANIHLNTIRLLKLLNTPPSVNLLADGVVDALDSTIALDNSSFPAWQHDTLNNLVNNGIGTVTPLTSQQFPASAGANKIIITIVEEDIDPVVLNTDLIVEASRNGGASWATGTVISKGSYDYPSSARRILIAFIDVSGHSDAGSIRWRVSTPTSRKIKIHAIGASYQYDWISW
jgi:hypothetical protein